MEAFLELAKQFGLPLAEALVAIWALTSGAVVPRYSLTEEQRRTEAFRLLYERERELRQKAIDEREKELADLRREIEEARRARP